MSKRYTSLKNFWVVAFCLALHTLHAQSSSSLQFGLTAGPALATIRGDLKPVYGYKSTHTPKLDFYAGLVFSYSLNNNKLSLLAEPTFERRGSNAETYIWSYSGPEKLDDVRENFNYVTLPLMARYYFDKQGKYFLNTGYTFAYMLDHHSIQLADELNPDRSRDASHQNPRLDFSIPVGVGYKMYNRKKEEFHIEVRHQLGLTNLNKDETNYVKSAFHRMTTLRFSVFFKGRK